MHLFLEIIFSILAYEKLHGSWFEKKNRMDFLDDPNQFSD